VALVMACLLVAGSAPASALDETQDATCRAELAAAHHKLRGFGVADVGGTVEAVAELVCLDLAQKPFLASVRVTIDVMPPDSTAWVSAADRSCSSPSSGGIVLLNCTASLRYDDPALTGAAFRGCVDLVMPVDLPRRCVKAIVTP
jgi:hypothetical protein